MSFEVWSLKADQKLEIEDEEISSEQMNHLPASAVMTDLLLMQTRQRHGPLLRASCAAPTYLFSRSGMERFRLMKHIFRLMTFRSLDVEEELLCLGEPESSLPL